MNLAQACVTLRCANLVLLLVWLKSLQMGGLLVDLAPVYAVLILYVLGNAAVTLLNRASAALVRAGLALGDIILIAWASAWAQAPAADAHLALIVPALVGASTLTLPQASTVVGAAVMAWATVWGLSAGARPAYVPRAAVLILAGASGWVLGEVSWRRRRGQGISPVVSVARSTLFNEFLSFVLFQIREYLTSLTTVSSHLALAATDPAERELSGKLEKMIGELNGKVGRMLDSVQSNTTMRGAAKHAAEFELGPLLKECLDVVRSTYPSAQVKVRLGVDREIGRIEGDWEALRTVFCSVAANAFEAAERNSGVQTILTVVAAKRYQAAEIEFKDDAGGVAPEHQASLFQPLFTTKAAFGGVGLGLAMSRRIMERSGGTVLLKSDKAGTAVTVRVPLKPSLPFIRDAESTWAGRRQNI